jgi:ubiquinone/menaquinone biosynthesis C-methylase UbiE
MKDYLQPWTDTSLVSVKKKYHDKYWSKHHADNEYKVVIDYIKKLNPKSVLEIGCGNGKNIRSLNKYMDNVDFYGIDISTAGIDYAKKKSKGDFRVCDARKLPFKDDYFDVVFTVHALEQMKYFIEKVSKEIYRVCKNHVVLFEPYFVQQNIFGKWHNIRSEYVQGIPFYIEDAGFEIIEFSLLDKNAISKSFMHKTGVIVAKKTKN